MKLVELAYFTDNVRAMADFYRALLGAEPVAQSDDMAILMSGETKIFIHKKYPASAGALPPENHTKGLLLGALRLPARPRRSSGGDHRWEKITVS